MSEALNTATCTLGAQDYLATVHTGTHSYQIDEPQSVGGSDQFASPMQHLLGALASCTAITLRMYAQRKQWDLGEVSVDISLEIQVEAGIKSYQIHKNILFGNTLLDEKQKTRLLRIAHKCPVSLVIENQVEMYGKVSS